MSKSPAKVCPLCGFNDCENVQQNFDFKHGRAGTNQSVLTQSPDQSQQIEAAARLLAKSKSPLICGLNCLDIAAQMAAWKLADQVHAIIDSSLTNHSHAATQSLQKHGKVSATYGEISSRSDLLVFWDCDLQAKHACLLRLLTNGQVPNRKIVFVGSHDSPMAETADIVFPMDLSRSRNSMVQLICRLRALVGDQPLLDDRFSDDDLPRAKVQELFRVLQTASYGSLFFDCHQPDWEFDLETESLLQLVNEFNSIRPLVGVKIRDDVNGLGAETVLTLASGFPAAINLQRGRTESSGTLYSAVEVLRRSACDTILLCGNTDDNASRLNPDWLQDRLQRATVIQLAPRSEIFTDVFIACPTLEFGKPFAGEVFRGDGAMLSAVIPDAEFSAETIFNSLADAFQNVLN